MKNQKVDAIVIGGGLAGLVTAYVLSSYGYKSVLFEKNKILGGGNKSFLTKDGYCFDYGYHSLDHMRSVVTTRLFEKVLDDNFYNIELKRAIVLENYLIPYNHSLTHWPPTLKKMFSVAGEPASITGEINRNEIAAKFGSEYSHYAFDQILRSYPSIKWSLDNGGNEADFSDLIYPWFFPNFGPENVRATESHAYHDNIRNLGCQNVLYPKTGGFEQFCRSLQASININYCDLRVGVKDLKTNLDEDGKTLISVTNEGVTYEADHYFWCAPPVFLLKLLNMSMVKGIPQKIVLGSFVFENELSDNFHEILVGSCNHQINRISFPGLLSRGKNNQIQVEYYFPIGEYPEDSSYWFEGWEKSLKALGLIEVDNKIIERDFRTEHRGLVTKKNLVDITRESVKNLDDLKSNIVVPYFNFGPENINRVIPGVINSVTKNILGDNT